VVLIGAVLSVVGRSIMFNLLRPLASLLFALSITTPLFAGSISVKMDKLNDSLMIDAENASIDDVLNEIRSANGFEVTRNGRGEPSVVSGQYEGPIESVVLRILRRENHMIVFSGDTGGISRIVLYRASKLLPLRTAQETAALFAVQQPAPIAITTPQPVSSALPQPVTPPNSRALAGHPQPATKDAAPSQPSLQLNSQPLAGRRLRGAAPK
jgi:hypothetical protein